MALTSTISFTAAGGGTTISGVTASASGNNITQIADTIAASTTHQSFAIGIDVSTIQSLFIYTDGALTVKTNSTGSPDQTLTFAANQPLVWAYGMPVTCPLTTDVTMLYFTNGSSTDAVNIYGVINQNV